MADSLKGQTTVGTSAVRITTTADTPVGSGLKVCAYDTDIYYACDSGISTSTGMVIKAGTETTINPMEFQKNTTSKQPDLSTMYFICGSAGKLITWSIVRDQ